MQNKLLSLLLSLLVVSFLSACNGQGTSSYPKTPEELRKDARGKLTGEGLTIFGGSSDDSSGGGTSPIGVNSFLWRATLDTLSFMPIASADPFGGVIVTDWYENPEAKGERFKINALIMDRTLRADGIKITLFKQSLDDSNVWRDAATNTKLSRDLEDTILTRARQLRVESSR